MFNSVFEFELSLCNDLLSGHLEQVAISCPDPQRLSLWSSWRCLRSLQGLQLIASYCSKLQGLNLTGIKEVEDHVLFWEVLSGTRLTHLALESCITAPANEDDIVKLTESCQKFVSLKAIKLNFDYGCDICISNAEFVIRSYNLSIS